MTARFRFASLVSIFLAAALLFAPLSGAADDKDKKDTPAKKSASAAPQPVNAEYTADIVKNTTEKLDRKSVV